MGSGQEVRLSIAARTACSRSEGAASVILATSVAEAAPGPGGVETRRDDRRPRTRACSPSPGRSPTPLVNNYSGTALPPARWGRRRGRPGGGALRPDPGDARRGEFLVRELGRDRRRPPEPLGRLSGQGSDRPRRRSLPHDRAPRRAGDQWSVHGRLWVTDAGAAPSGPLYR